MFWNRTSPPNSSKIRVSRTTGFNTNPKGQHRPWRCRTWHREQKYILKSKLHHVSMKLGKTIFQLRKNTQTCPNKGVQGQRASIRTRRGKTDCGEFNKHGFTKSIFFHIENNTPNSLKISVSWPTGFNTNPKGQNRPWRCRIWHRKQKYIFKSKLHHFQ